MKKHHHPDERSALPTVDPRDLEQVNGGWGYGYGGGGYGGGGWGYGYGGGNGYGAGFRGLGFYY